MKSIGWTPEVQKDLQRLDRRTKERIVSAVERLAETGHGDVRRVHERPGENALRVGDWRVFFRYTTEQAGESSQKIDEIRVLRIRSRGQAYGRV